MIRIDTAVAVPHVPCMTLGREGKVVAKPRDAQCYPNTVAMDRQVRHGTRQSGLQKAQMDCRATQCLDQERSGVSPVQHAGSGKGKSRVQARLPGAQSAQNGGDAGKLKVKHSGKRQSDATSQLQSATASPATCVLVDAFTIVSILWVPEGEYAARKITLPPSLLGLPLDITPSRMRQHYFNINCRIQI